MSPNWEHVGWILLSRAAGCCDRVGEGSKEPVRRGVRGSDRGVEIPDACIAWSSEQAVQQLSADTSLPLSRAYADLPHKQHVGILRQPVRRHEADESAGPGVVSNDRGTGKVAAYQQVRIRRIDVEGSHVDDEAPHRRRVLRDWTSKLEGRVMPLRPPGLGFGNYWFHDVWQDATSPSAGESALVRSPRPVHGFCSAPGSATVG